MTLVYVFTVLQLRFDQFKNKSALKLMVNEPVIIPGLAKQVVSREGHRQGCSRRNQQVHQQNKDWLIMICMSPISNKGRMWNDFSHGLS